VKVVVVFVIMALVCLWMRVLNVEDGMRKTSDAIKLIAAGIMELKLKIDR
jgi:hypothetical protein